MVGVWDRIERTAAGEVFIVEFKSNVSSGRIVRDNQKLAQASLQLQLYMWAYAKVTQEYPTGAILRSLDVQHEQNPRGLVLFDPKSTIRDCEAIINTTFLKIQKKDFQPTPSFIGCAFCPFADICVDAK